MQKENTMTVGRWCGRWFITNRHKWNGNTEGGYRNLIYSHIIPSIGSVALSDLTEQTVTDFYDSLQNWGLSARSVWCVHLLLRRCMDKAAQDQLIPYNPVRLCQEPKAEEYIPITKEDTRRGSTPRRCAEQPSVPRLRQTPRKQNAAGTACGAWQT